MIVLKVRNLLRRKREKVLEQRLLIFQKRKKEVFKNKTFEINKIKDASSKEEEKRNGWWNQ